MLCCVLYHRYRSRLRTLALCRPPHRAWPRRTLSRPVDQCLSRIERVRRVQDLLWSHRPHRGAPAADPAQHGAGVLPSPAQSGRERRQLDAHRDPHRDGGAVRGPVRTQPLPPGETRAAAASLVGTSREVGPMRPLLLALLVLSTGTLEAQTVRGQPVDSISRAPVAGAFVTLVEDRK